jgi:hypothetical protein
VLFILLLARLQNQLAFLFVECDTALFQIYLSSLSEQAADMRMLIGSMEKVHSVFCLHEDPVSRRRLDLFSTVVQAGMQGIHLEREPRASNADPFNELQSMLEVNLPVESPKHHILEDKWDVKLFYEADVESRLLSLQQPLKLEWMEREQPHHDQFEVILLQQQATGMARQHLNVGEVVGSAILFYLLRIDNSVP